MSKFSDQYYDPNHPGFRVTGKPSVLPDHGGADAGVTETLLNDEWSRLVEKDDRTSPEEYPEMCLITREEVGEIIDAALSKVDANASAEARLMREALTPSAETKAAYMGEFHFFVDDIDADGEHYNRTVTVPWTTIKEIMKAILDRALSAHPHASDCDKPCNYVGPCAADVTALADAMWQLLDDMGENGQGVCLAAKAQARVAYEAFREDEYADWMPLERAKQVLKDAGV